MAAVANPKGAFEFFLDKTRGRIQITEEILVGVAWNPHGTKALSSSLRHIMRLPSRKQ